MNLHEALHAIADLVPWREESQRNAVHDAIAADAEAAATADQPDTPDEEAAHD